jgi:DNA primase
MASIPAETIREIRDRAQLESVVRDFVQLEKKGRRLVGLCPFHSEKTPSFGVSPDKQLFHCFGCQAGGDVFEFVMRIEGLSFPEAVRWLAARVGIELPEDDDPEEAKRQQARERQLDVNARAARFFEQHRARSPEAERYLTEERGIGAEALASFRVGYAPEGWDTLAKALVQARLDGVGAKLGLVGKRDRDGTPYDRFRGRIMFPIEATDGAVLGFGARRAEWTGDDGPKYLNSPDSPIYDKSSVLYGLRQAQRSLRQTKQALLVEGYLDVIALAQAGLSQTVAACGTAFTSGHAKRLTRLVDEVVTLYDGDAAGQAATYKAAQVLLQAGLRVRVVVLPAEHDPDTFVRAEGLDALVERIRRAPSAVDFFVDRARRTAGGGGVAGMTQAMDEVVPLVRAIADPLQRDVALEGVARRMGLDPRTLRRHLGARGGGRAPDPRHGPRSGPRGAELARRPPDAEAPPEPPVAGPPPTAVERAVFRSLLDQPELTLGTLERRNALDAFTTVAFQAAVDSLVGAIRGGEPVSGPRALEIAESAGLKDAQTLTELRKTLTEDLPATDDVDVLVVRLLKQRRKNRLRSLRSRIEAATDPDERAALEAELAAVADEILSSHAEG